MGKLHGAAKAAFLAKMAAGRKHGAKRARKAHHNVPAVVNPPRRKRAHTHTPAKRTSPIARLFHRRARRNPPTVVVREALAAGAAAILGGLLAHALVKVAAKISSPTVADVASVALPVVLGAVVTQMDHRQSQAIAAGAFGVAGAALASAISNAIAQRNPPLLPAQFYVDNPPRLRGDYADTLRDTMNEGYRDGVTAALGLT